MRRSLPRPAQGWGGYNVDTVGGDVFTGYRLSRWVSVEGFFDYRFATGPSSSQEGVGAMCVGSIDHWRTDVLGARLWIHALHLRSIDVSIAPSMAAGAAFDRADATTIGGNPCRTYVVTGAGWAFDGGLDFSVEVRPTPWLGLRAMLETSIDLRNSGYEWFGVASVGGWVGPILRF